MSQNVDFDRFLDLNQALADGRARADRYYGPTCRTFDRNLGGVAAMLRAVGRPLPRDPAQVAEYGETAADCLAAGRRWSDSSMTDGQPDAAEIVRCMGWAVEGLPKDLEASYQLSSRVLEVPYGVWDLQAAGTQSDLGTAEQYLDREIKRRWPEKRRKSRAYIEVFDANLPKALVVVATDLATKRERLQTQLDRLQREYLSKLDAAACWLNGAEQRVLDVLALDPSNAHGLAAQAALTAKRAAVEQYRGGAAARFVLADLSSVVDTCAGLPV